MDQFEAFETKRFVGRLLGRGDVSGLMDKIQVRAQTAHAPIHTHTPRHGGSVWRAALKTVLCRPPASFLVASGQQQLCAPPPHHTALHYTIPKPAYRPVHVFVFLLLLLLCCAGCDP